MLLTLISRPNKYLITFVMDSQLIEPVVELASVTMMPLTASEWLDDPVR